MTQKFLKNEFHTKNKELFQSILEYIINAEQNTDQLLKSSLIGWSGMLQNTDNLNIDKMRIDSKSFAVTSLAILNKDGTETSYDTELDFEDRQKLDAKHKGDKYYFCVFENNCQEYRNLQNPELANIPIVTAITKPPIRQIPVKWAIMFDTKLQKYLYAEYSRDFFTNILHNIFNKYQNIKYIVSSRQV